MTNTRVKRIASVIFYIAFFPVMFYIASKHNPLDYYVEAGDASYYQARIAFERGAERERDQLRTIAENGKITMHDYEKIVFPAWLKTIQDSQPNFPANEQAKSHDQIRAEFFQATRR